jgi:sulfite exporter TauE/SafE
MKNLEALLIIALKLNYLSEAIFDEISETIEKLRRMILNFIKYQKQKSPN